MLGAATLRFWGLNWDGGIGAHPDERYIVGIAERLRFPYRLNPLDIAPDLAYGHLPLYLLWAAGGLVRSIDWLLLGRALAASVDVGAVALTFVLGRRVFGHSVGFVAALFAAFTVFQVQQAHFYTTDGLVAALGLGALLFCARLAEDGQPLDAWLAGAWTGLALGTKFSAALLILPLGTACVISEGGQATRWRHGLRSGAGTLLAFAVTNPFALSAFPSFWNNVIQQGAIARGLVDVPYTRQFHATLPFIYPFVQQLRWGMGWSLGLAAFGGLVYAIYKAVWEPPSRAEWVVLSWAVPGLAFTSVLYAKYPRYLLTFVPSLLLYAARLFVRLGECGRGVRRGGRYLLRLSLSLVLVSSVLRCLALVDSYRSPHPWQVASQWFQAHVPPGAVIAIEQWDHPLPIDATRYDQRELPIFGEDSNQEKWVVMAETLTEADYIVIASRRGYGALARWPERYPVTVRYYRELFAGKLDFEPVACFGRYPRLGSAVLLDDPTSDLGFSLPALCLPDTPLVVRLGRLDESFVVYDHPQVVIFQRKPLFLAE